MPRIAKELSPLEVKRLTKPGRYAVGGVRGLYLYASDTGARSWVLRIKVGTRRREIGLGPYPEAGLADARDRAREYRQAIAEGRDPVAEREQARRALETEQARRVTFEDAAKRCHAAKSPEFRSDKHRSDWINSLRIHAFPVIGRMLVNEIEMPDVQRVLDPIWHEKTETATRVRQRIEAVLAWAAVNKMRQSENPARWQGNLEHALAAPNKIRKVQHMRALTYHEVGQFMADLRQRDGMGARALEFAILTAARSGEVRGMTWDEVDLDAKLWTVPADRIKSGRKHRVPLSDAALAVLEAMPEREGLVFRAVRGGPLSDMTLSAVCKRMKVDATPHGFRSTFKDWARSCTRFPDEASELALAHVNSDKTRAAYARDELLPIRRRLMRDWARFLDTPLQSGEVVALEGAR
jgi:integrase